MNKMNRREFMKHLGIGGVGLAYLAAATENGSKGARGQAVIYETQILDACCRLRRENPIVDYDLLVNNSRLRIGGVL